MSKRDELELIMTMLPMGEGNNLDPWHRHYADRTAGLSASEVRALFAVASRPEVVSLAGGMPYVSALPSALVNQALERVMRDHGPVALQYGSGQGTIPVREQILEVMALEGIRASIDDVVVTTGSQQGLDLVTKLFINPGDVILAESPSYVGAIGVFRSYQAEMVHVATDEHGLVPESLREMIRSLKVAGKTVKFLYLIPNFQNPSGVTLTWDRRIEILEIAKTHQILVLEDNPYGLLYFDAAPPHAMRSVETDGVIYLGTFSKTFAPGLRLGWAVAPHAIREKLILANESAVLSPSVFTQYVMSEYFTHSDWRGQINTFRQVYQERKTALTDALAESLPDLSRTDPSGGFYVWLTLPAGLDSKAMLPRAIKELIAYTPGTAFYANGDGRHNIRLSFCYPTPEAIKVGVRRLAKTINEELDLLETFAGTGELSMITRGDRVTSLPPNID